MKMSSIIYSDLSNKEDRLSDEMSKNDQPTTTNMPAISIKPIDKGTVHRICSGQVVLSLAVAVKELVENSLDARATCIEIRLKEYGSNLIEISDNGSGVQPHDFIGLALKHYTSKLESFENLVTVKTYGFRGEALSSLCALSNMTVTTRHCKQLIGARLSYNHNGQLIKEVPISRNEGTTVSLQNIFCTLPVRHKEFLRNLKKEYNKMIQILYSYCLIASNVRISCTNQCDKGKISTIVSTEVHSMMRENIVSIFGVKQLSSLLTVIQRGPSSEALAKYGVSHQANVNVNSEEFFKLEGFVSSCAHGQGRSMADRQFFYINNRPCDPIKISRVVNEVYHHYNKHQFPMIVLNIQMKEDDVDINVTPDKRKIFVNRENFLLATIKTTLDCLYNSIPSTFCIQQDLGNFCTSDSELHPSSDPKKRLSILSEKFACPIKRSQTSNLIQNSKDGIKRSLSEKVEEISNERKKLKLQEVDFPNTNLPKTEVNGNGINCQEAEETLLCFVDDENCIGAQVASIAPLANDTSIDNIKHNKTSKFNIDVNHIDYGSQPKCSSILLQSPLINNDHIINKSNCKRESKNTVLNSTSHKYSQANSRTNDFINNLLSKKANIFSNKKNKFPLSNDIIPVENKAELDDSSSVNNSLIDLTEEPTSECHVILEEVDNKSFASETVRSLTIPFSMTSLKEKLISKKERKRNNELLMRKFRATISPMDNKTAEDELKKEVSKTMFKEMIILGQFNLGFIICRLGPDLFIIDQHATDEKFNFEMLKNNYVIKNQKLINPQSLDLTVVNESILIDNIDIFTKNGFEFKINELDQLGKRVLLVAIPCSRGWEFGKEDIEEMIFMLSDSPGVFCRPSRVRSMFASRACRKSVMIGTALSFAQMRTLVDNMGEIEQPWNCPHGRPTMRHLVNLDVVAKATL